MMTARWKGRVLAQSDDTVVVEGNHYFPADSVDETLLRPSDHHSYCGWKGDCSYYSVEVDGERNDNAAWYYAEPLPRAENIRGRIAFWKGVEVTEE